MSTVYLTKPCAQRADKNYIGYTDNPERRVSEHNSDPKYYSIKYPPGFSTKRVNQ